MLYDICVSPFSYGFMQHTLMGCVCLSLSCGPMGVLLILRRMSLFGDALSHSILPGVALAYLWFGLSLFSLVIGGILAGILVAIISGLAARFTFLKEDASFAGFFLLSLALGVLIISTQNNMIDLLHILFGSPLAVDTQSLYVIASIVSISLLVLAFIYRPLILECFDHQYFAFVFGKGSLYHLMFLLLLVINLVGGFQSLGTLLSLGLMMLPAISARLWVRTLRGLFITAAVLGAVSSYGGLILSFHYDLPTGPSIVLCTGLIYIISLICGRNGGVLYREDYASY